MFKYISKKIAMRVFSGMYINEIIVKIIKVAHLKTKAKYRFINSFFGLLAI